MRFLLPGILALLLAACSQQGQQGSAYNNSGIDSLAIGGPSDFGAGAVARAHPSLMTCLISQNTAQAGVPSLASGVLQKTATSGSNVKIGLEDVLGYTSNVLGASGGDGITAAEIISSHEAADTNCLRKLAGYWTNQTDSADAAKNAEMLRRASGALGQAYSTLKTYTASGDARDLSERLSRSYVPVGMKLPRVVL